MRFIFVALLLPLVSSCASQDRARFTSPAGVIVIHDKGNRDRAASYTLKTPDDRIVGGAPSIIDAATVANVPGLPVDQVVKWSPTGKTAVIYENMSDASPEYRHILLRQRRDSDSFDAFQVDLGSRSTPLPDVYGEWPSVDRVTDEDITLQWPSAPHATTLRIAEISLTQPTSSER